MTRFAVTIFLSAFLLFQVQPLISKYILPWFGGTPAVWATCLVFFQVVLLAGYAYAHLSSEKLPRPRHVGLHLALLAASLLVLPIVPRAETWKPLSHAAPEPEILLLLAVTVGLPFFLLSSTAPLVQRWSNLVSAGPRPYRLYALSNVGSLLALLSYPVLVEPLMRLRWQALVWSGAYAGFAALSAWCAVSALSLSALSPSATGEAAWRGEQAGEADVGDNRTGTAAPGSSALLLWLVLAACGSALLLATTNQMCQEIAVVPFLWILPLATYLLTFILCFEHDRWYSRVWFGLPLAVLVPATCGLIAAGPRVDLRIHVLVYTVTLFVACMICHGELARAKPHPRHLTLFYLMAAAGGALGGVFVALLAPRVFDGYWEYPLSLAAVCVLAVICWWRAGEWQRWADRPLRRRALLTGLAGGFLSAAIFVWTNERASVVFRTRSFYGVLRVTDHSDDKGDKRILTHGSTLHGSQWLDDDKRTWPTTYYGHSSGVGLAIEFHPRRFSPDQAQRPLHIGAVGLGAGTIAALGRGGDHFRFYEINPHVAALSEHHFTYRRDSNATSEVILGDARLQLEDELVNGAPRRFDVLAVDAFNSDAVPTHLVTREAVDLYWEHLADDGLLLFHISNQSVDLAPIVRAHALHLGCDIARISSRGDAAEGTNYNTWLILTRNRTFMDLPAVRSAASSWTPQDPEPITWTDDFAGLWHVLKF